MGKTILLRRLYSPATISSSYEIDAGTLTRVYGEGYVFDRHDWELVVFPLFYASSADGTLKNKLINRELSKVKLMYAIGNTNRWYDITEVPKFSELDYWIDDTESDTCGAFMFCGKTTVGQQMLLKVTAEWVDKRDNKLYQVETEDISIVTIEEMEDEKRFFITEGTNNIEYNPFISRGGAVQSFSVGLHSGAKKKNLREEIESGRLRLAVTDVDNNNLFDKKPIVMNVLDASISYNPMYRYSYMLGDIVGTNDEIKKNSQGYVIAPNGAQLNVDFVSIEGYARFVLQGGSSIDVFPDGNGKCTYYLENFDVLQTVTIYGFETSSIINLNFIGSSDYLSVNVNCGTEIKDFFCFVQLKKKDTILDTLPVSMKRVEPVFDVVMENNAPLETGVRKIPYSIYVDGNKVDNPTKYFNVSFSCVKEKVTGLFVPSILTATNDSYLEITIDDEDVALELTDSTTYKKTY